MKLGFIGIGNMGKPMATTLMKANHQVSIFDLNPKPLEELAKLGAIVKNKIAEIPPSAEVIFLSLPSHVAVEEVMLGAGGVLSALKEGQIVVDTTTSLPSTSRKIAEQVKKAGGDFLDASLSGGPDGAAAQTLTFMVGGEAKALERVRGLLETLGKKIFHIGSNGLGNAMKLINNMITATNTACFMEGLVVGTKAGIPADTLFDVISSCSGNSYAFQKKAPRILGGNFKPMFALDLEYKDIALGTMVAQDLKAPVFLASVAKALFEMARAKGLGQEDNVALIKVLEEISGVQVRR